MLKASQRMLFFMQEEASVQITRPNIFVFNENSRSSSIGTCDTASWPAISIHLASLDFSIKAFVKNRVCKASAASVKQFI